jgi:hypothetical protein
VSFALFVIRTGTFLARTATPELSHKSGGFQHVFFFRLANWLKFWIGLSSNRLVIYSDRQKTWFDLLFIVGFTYREKAGWIWASHYHKRTIIIIVWRFNVTGWGVFQLIRPIPCSVRALVGRSPFSEWDTLPRIELSEISFSCNRCAPLAIVQLIWHSADWLKVRN